jgi:hypothetical protein
MATALEGSEGPALRPGRYLPPEKTRYPLYRRLGGPQGRPGQMRKISPPPGFDLWIFQPVASRYTDYATWPTTQFGTEVKERVGLYFYSSSVPSWQVMGWIFSLNLSALNEVNILNDVKLWTYLLCLSNYLVTHHNKVPVNLWAPEFYI